MARWFRTRFGHAKGLKIGPSAALPTGPETLQTAFGIRVTIVEPGFFRTDFLAGNSVRYGTVEIEDYAAATAAQRKHYDERSGKQAGDPRKLAEAIVKIVASDDPPLRYAAGSDAVQMTRQTLEKRLAELARWEDLSNSTNVDAA